MQPPLQYVRKLRQTISVMLKRLLLVPAALKSLKMLPKSVLVKSIISSVSLLDQRKARYGDAVTGVVEAKLAWA